VCDIPQIQADIFPRCRYNPLKKRIISGLKGYCLQINLGFLVFRLFIKLSFVVAHIWGAGRQSGSAKNQRGQGWLNSLNEGLDGIDSKIKYFHFVPCIKRAILCIDYQVNNQIGWECSLTGFPAD